MMICDFPLSGSHSESWCFVKYAFHIIWLACAFHIAPTFFHTKLTHPGTDNSAVVIRENAHRPAVQLGVEHALAAHVEVVAVH